MTRFENLNVGDMVTRMLGGTIPMKLPVSAMHHQIIICSAWQFDRATGAAIDEVLGWGPPPHLPGSYIDSSKTECSTSRVRADDAEIRTQGR
mgnify:CR=1 FL=1